MSPGFVLKVLLRIFLLISFIGFGFYLLYIEKYFAALFLGIVVIVTIYEFILFLGKIYSDIHKAILSMQYEDYSLQIPENNAKLSLYKDLERLYQKNKLAFLDQQSIQIIYENLINGLDFGVIILRKKEAEISWGIYLMNDYISKTLETPKYKNWNFLEERLSNFTQLFEDANFEEFNKTIELSLDYSENQTFSLKTSRIRTYEYTYYIISMDSVQSIIEKKEKQAWYNLMNVISHELMNTLTPIHSLVDNMEYLSGKKELTSTDKEDFQISLKTVKKKALHLMDFVESYRQLANIPSPVKKPVKVQELLDSSVRIMQPILQENEIEIHLRSNQKEMGVLLDVKLMERVLVNLITNSMYSLMKKEGERKITIDSYRKKKRTYIVIEDNGLGIDPSIRDKIFVPFFTTREEGAGIGLTLSKSIVESHNGYITFKSSKESTQFILTFIE